MAKDHIDMKTKTSKTLDYNDTQGGVDPGGSDEGKKGNGGNDVKSGNAQNAKDLFKVDAMGTDAAKKVEKQKSSGDHFKVSTEVEPSGTEAGKAGAGRNVG